MTWKDFAVGDRIEMVFCGDPYAPIAPRERGTVTNVAPPPINTLSVSWDNGRTLGVALDEDVVRKVED